MRSMLLQFHYPIQSMFQLHVPGIFEVFFLHGQMTCLDFAYCFFPEAEKLPSDIEAVEAETMEEVEI